MSKRRPYTPAELDQVRQRYANERTDTIARDLGREIASIHRAAAQLGVRKSPELVAQIARERTLKPGHGSHASRFPKGHAPANKGVKRPGYAPGNMSATQFKPGNKPHTTMPIGSYRICEGQLQQKTSEAKGGNHKRWTPVSRLVWERAHGLVPPGHKVVFKSGRASVQLEAITLDAVELVTCAELLRRNSIHRMPAALKEVVQLKGRIRSIITKREKRRDQKVAHD